MWLKIVDSEWSVCVECFVLKKVSDIEEKFVIKSRKIVDAMFSLVLFVAAAVFL